MIPAPIKRVFFSQTCGMALCLLALFLIGNTLYLNAVRDQKDDAVESIGQALDDYQSALSRSRHSGLPDAFHHNIQYGALLKTTLDHFKTDGQGITIHEIRLERSETAMSETTMSETAQTSSDLKGRRKKKQATQQTTTLRISGSIPANSSEIRQSEPYGRLNHVMDGIQAETGCRFILQSAGETLDPEQKNPNDRPVDFSIRLIPSAQPTCSRKFTRSGDLR